MHRSALLCGNLCKVSEYALLKTRKPASTAAFVAISRFDGAVNFLTTGIARAGLASGAVDLAVLLNEQIVMLRNDVPV